MIYILIALLGITIIAWLTHKIDSFIFKCKLEAVRQGIVNFKKDPVVSADYMKACDDVTDFLKNTILFK